MLLLDRGTDFVGKDEISRPGPFRGTPGNYRGIPTGSSALGSIDGFVVVIVIVDVVFVVVIVIVFVVGIDSTLPCMLALDKWLGVVLCHCHCHCRRHRLFVRVGFPMPLLLRLGRFPGLSVVDFVVVDFVVLPRLFVLGIILGLGGEIVGGACCRRRCRCRCRCRCHCRCGCCCCIVRHGGGEEVGGTRRWLTEPQKQTRQPCVVRCGAVR
mmetsp:Transcript_28051/g.65860  ORF Transcript_28051/g.65860 Transcript_28051/m.65860 type:complete len:211 (+) Transcript_28051:657-1289(+)